MKIVLLILLTITMNVAIGQTTVNSLPDNRDKNFKLAFNQEEFGDRFCVFILRTKIPIIMSLTLLNWKAGLKGFISLT